MNKSPRKSTNKTPVEVMIEQVEKKLIDEMNQPLSNELISLLNQAKDFHYL